MQSPAVVVASCLPDRRGRDDGGLGGAADDRAPADAARHARPARPRPTPSQLAWQREELALFVHFTVNTFTDKEWGDGSESPRIFDPARLDARQWARAAKRGGFRSLILTAKHHDGFCLWPTRTTDHSVRSSPWRSGTGDLVREFADACRAEGLGAGLYLSPWDRNARSYGQGRAYNDFYLAQLKELLGQLRPAGRGVVRRRQRRRARTASARPTTGRASTPRCGACSPRP